MLTSFLNFNPNEIFLPFCSQFNSTVFTLHSVCLGNGDCVLHKRFISIDRFVCVFVLVFVVLFFLSLCRTELCSSNWNLIKAENVLRLQQTKKKKNSIWLNIQWKHSNGEVMCAFNCTLNNNLILNSQSQITQCVGRVRDLESGK